MVLIISSVVYASPHNGRNDSHNGCSCGNRLAVEVPTSLWIGNMLKNEGVITLQGVGSNIVVGKDVMNRGSIKSEDSLYCRKVKKVGEIDVKEIEEENACLQPPPDYFSKEYPVRVSYATYIFRNDGEVVKDGINVEYGEYQTDGITFRWNGDSWEITGTGYIQGNMVFEATLKLTQAWIDILGDLTVDSGFFYF